MASNILTITLPTQDPALFQRATRFSKLAQSIVIDSHAMHSAAADDLIAIKALQKRLEDQRTSEVVPLNDEVKKINDGYREPTAWLADAEVVLKSKILMYTQAEAKKATEQARIAEAAARAERERAEAAARAERERAEKMRQEAAAGDEKAQAEAAEQARIAEAAAASLELVASVITAPAVPATRKVKGISTSKTWKARITDKAALLAYIAQHPECIEWVDIKMTPLTGMAKALHENMRIPGVEAYIDETISARSM